MGEERARMVCGWVRLAMEDLRYSRVGMEQGLEPKYAAFHAQQAVEKALKALLISLGVSIPKTHDIEVLLAKIAECGLDVAPFYKIEADALTDYAVEARYPSPPITREEAEEAYKVAAETLKLVAKKLQELGLECY